MTEHWAPHSRSATTLGDRMPTNVLDAFWVATLAAHLELVVAARDLGSARSIAREGLEKLVDPFLGIRNVPDDLRLRWRIAARRKENDG